MGFDPERPLLADFRHTQSQNMLFRFRPYTIAEYAVPIPASQRLLIKHDSQQRQ